ncbi:MAG TPA: rhodanese-like domain-containing protein [Candidatus Sulfopaludibacter sp.]|nr:rhodanese-like domain-containing protein [Candidatus Sulfopaludibacter sp.]
MRIIPIAALTLAGAYSGFSQAAPHPPGAAFQAMVKDARSRIREVSSAQLKEWLASPARPILIDVREDSEWQAGHAATAIHIGRGVLEREIEPAVPDKSARVVLYCHSGARSALAADTLQRMGYTSVFSLAGGMQAYQAASLPMQK